MDTYRFERASGIQRHKQTNSIFFWFITYYKSMGLVSKKMRFFIKSAFLPQDILENMVRRNGLLDLGPKIQRLGKERPIFLPESLNNVILFRENRLVTQGKIPETGKYRKRFLERQIFDAPARNTVFNDVLGKIKNIKFSCIFLKIFVILKSIIKPVRDYVITNGVKSVLSGLLGGAKNIKNNKSLFLKILDQKIFGRFLLSFLFFSCVSFFNPSTTLAETVSYESALVWRTDSLGDYLLSPMASNSTTVVAPGIVAKGVINSITATWKFEGQANLEVSADDGLHYTPLTNGVPLKEGFVQGTNLKWKAILGADSKLNEVILTYTDSSGMTGSFGNPTLSGFKYRKSFKVAGSSSGPLYNYQIKIKVGESKEVRDADINCEGHTALDFQDVRFALTDGQTPLSYYLEKITGDKPNRVAEFFVKVAQIPQEGITLYLYYGNPNAKNLSDAKEAFDFYEDFRGNSLDANKWAMHLSTAGSSSLTDEGLVLDAAKITSKSFQFSGGIIEYSATAETGYEVRLIIRDPDPASEADISQVVYSSSYSGAQHCIAVGDIVRVNDAKRIAALTPYDYRVVADGDKITFERYGQGFTEKQASISYTDSFGPKKGYIGLKTAGLGRGKSLSKFHWIRVRKYANPEPLIDKTIVIAEESAALPQFANTAIALNGDLILAEGNKEGSYATAAIAAPYNIRIIVPSWKGSGASLDVSVDGGKTYKKDCTNSAYYYAAKGDFATGNSIKYRVAFKKNAMSSISKLESIVVPYALGNIIVLSPAGGEVWQPGSGQKIIWSAWDYEKSYPMKIEYSLDGGKTFKTIVAKAENSGAYSWNIPDDPAVITDQALVRVCDSYDDKVCGISGGMFSIAASSTAP